MSTPLNGPPTESATAAPGYRLWQLVAYILQLGTTGFGGPVTLVSHMHRDLVEGRGWISESEYREGLALAQLMPGPLAAQLAIYLGFVHYGVWGATLVGVAFVLPSFLMVVALGAAYVAFGGLAWMQAVFYGVGAAVIGIISLSSAKLTHKTIGSDWLLWAIYLVAAIATVVTESETVLLFLGAGFVAWLVRSPPWRRPPTLLASLWLWPLTLATTAATDASALQPLLVDIGLFFAKAGAFVFGSGLAIVPFLYGGVVTQFGWLNQQEFLDAVAVAMITPGPVVITVGFIGYLVCARVGGFATGLAGASVAALATFLPCYLLTILPAPYFKRFGQRPGIVWFISGVTAAAIGAITGSCVVLARRTLLVDGQLAWAKLAILAATVALLIRFKRLPEPLVVLAAAVVGLVVYPLVRP